MKFMKHPLVKEYSAKCLNRLADEIRTVFQSQKRGAGNVVSLGLPALQGLYIAKRESRRWYDYDGTLQKSLTALYSLPPEGLTVLSFKLTDIIGLIRLYDHVCEQTEQEPTIEDLFRVTKTGLVAGKDEATSALSDIVGKELFEEFNRGT